MSTQDPLRAWRRQRLWDRLRAGAVISLALSGVAAAWASLPQGAPIRTRLHDPPLQAAPSTAPVPRRVWKSPADDQHAFDTGGAVSLSWRPEVSEELLLQLSNDARAQSVRCTGERWFGPSPPLKLDVRLSTAAQQQAGHLLRTGQFAHYTADNPRGAGPAERAWEAGYNGYSIGENIAWGQPSAESVVWDWVDSPPHCKALMNPDFRRVGFGWRADPEMRTGRVWVMLLGN